MSGPTVPIQELLRLSVALSDGSITDDDFAQLDALLATDPKARAFYIEFTRLSAMLEQRSAYQAQHPEADEQGGDLVLAGLEADAHSFGDAGQWLAPPPEDVPLVDMTDELARRERVKKQTARRKLAAADRRRGQADPVQYNPWVIPKSVVWLGAAAAVILVAVLVAVVYQPPSTPPTASRPAPGGGRAASAPVATLTFMEDAVWSDTRGRFTLNSRVAPGVIRLESGVAHFVLDSGAVVMVQGPATLDLTSPWLAELEAGSLVAHVPETAMGFQVVGDGFTVTDLGTDFAVHADADGVRCRVVLGEVELAVHDATGAGITAQRLLENHLVALDRVTGRVEALDFEAADDIAWALPYAAQLNHELVVNGGFEDGVVGIAHASDHVDVVAIPGWDDTDPGTVLGYEQAGTELDVGFPDPRTDPMPDGRGEAYYFVRHPGTMTQAIDLSAAAVLTDAGQARFVFSADLGGYITQNDRALVAVIFLDAAGRELSRADLEPADAAARGGRTGFLHRSHRGALPAGTRSARIEVTGVRHIGGFTDGFADNISLVVEADTTHPQQTRNTPRRRSTPTDANHAASSADHVNPPNFLPAMSRARLDP